MVPIMYSSTYYYTYKEEARNMKPISIDIVSKQRYIETYPGGPKQWITIHKDYSEVTDIHTIYRYGNIGTEHGIYFLFITQCRELHWM